MTLAAMGSLATFITSVLLFTDLNQAKHYTRQDLFQKPTHFTKHILPPDKHRFTPEEIHQILEIHNSYRSMVYPTASDMKEVIWDKDLEDYAFRHTQACTGAHSDRTMVKKFKENDPKTWKTWYNMAENLYYSHGARYSIEEAIWMFWEEGSGYDINGHQCSHKQTCGHYLALTLGESTRIGCALNLCQKFTKSKYPTPAVFFSCIFNGMLLSGARPYSVGNFCSNCDRSFCRHRLCVTPANYFKKTGFDGNTSFVSLDPEIIKEIEHPSVEETTRMAPITSTSTSATTYTTTVPISTTIPTAIINTTIPTAITTTTSTTTSRTTTTSTTCKAPTSRQVYQGTVYPTGLRTRKKNQASKLTLNSGTTFLAVQVLIYQFLSSYHRHFS